MLQKTSRFQDDIKKYQTAINGLNDETVKLESTKLLNELISEVKKMDSMYLDMVYNKQLKSVGNEFREKIFTLRKKLSSKLNV